MSSICSTIEATCCGVAVAIAEMISLKASWLICPVSLISLSKTASRIVSKRSESVSAGKGRLVAVSSNTVVSVMADGASLVVGVNWIDVVVDVGVSVASSRLVVVVVVSDVVAVVVVSIIGALVDVCSTNVVVVVATGSICAG